MRLNDFLNRWKDEVAEDWMVVRSEDAEQVKINWNKAYLGDFLREYYLHLSIPWYKKIFWYPEWDTVELLMRRALNKRSIVQWCQHD